jgi:pimeloyl-ACP methyl ester carboxylesterase
MPEAGLTPDAAEVAAGALTTCGVTGPDGRTLRTFDAGGQGPAVLFHHGSPASGALLPPMLAAAVARDVRLIGYARPSYGGSDPLPGRDVASAAGDVAAILDTLDIQRCATFGASGGGPHALACAALLPDRITAVATLAGVAPFSDDYDWFAGMAAPDALRAARSGRAARAGYAETEEFDPSVFIDADWAALQGDWESLGRDAGAAGELGPDGLVDDDVAFASPWGFSPADVTVPALFVHGELDRMVPVSHAWAMLRSCPTGEIWLRPRDGHVSVLSAMPTVLDWLLAQD